MKNTLVSLAVVTILAAPGLASGAGKAKTMVMPDFTKGKKIPVGANHDWNGYIMLFLSEYKWVLCNRYGPVVTRPMAGAWGGK